MVSVKCGSNTYAEKSGVEGSSEVGSWSE